MIGGTLRQECRLPKRVALSLSPVPTAGAESHSRPTAATGTATRDRLPRSGPLHPEPIRGLARTDPTVAGSGLVALRQWDLDRLDRIVHVALLFGAAALERWQAIDCYVWTGRRCADRGEFAMAGEARHMIVTLGLHLPRVV